MLRTIERLAGHWIGNARPRGNGRARAARGRNRGLRIEPLEGRELLSQVVFSQAPDPAGGIVKSSWYPPDGLDGDAYAYDNFTLSSTQTITQMQWQGGYTNLLQGAGKSPVFDFTISIYDSIAAGSQPNVVSAPLVQYHVGGNAGETAAGTTAGGIPVYKYAYTLSTPFVAQAGTKYWVQIEASQGVTPTYGWPPDWGLQASTGGDNAHFYSITGGSLAGGTLYASGSGDLAFSLLAAGAAKQTPTVAVKDATYTYDAKAHATTATVTGPDGSPVKGTVSFFYSQNGVAVTPTDAGTYDVLATFTSSDPKYGGATGTGTITINRAHAAVKLSSSRTGPVPFGRPVTFTATVSSPDSTLVPGGYAVFLANGHYIGYGALANGVATFTTSSLPVGTDQVTAAYSGSNYFTGTSKAIAQVVSPDRTTTTLAIAPSGTVPAGQAVTLTVTVANNDASFVPTGTVIFMDGSTVLGKAALGPKGKASLTTTHLPRGVHPKITVQFAGSTNFAKSTSAPKSLTIA